MVVTLWYDTTVVFFVFFLLLLHKVPREDTFRVGKATQILFRINLVQRFERQQKLFYLLEWKLALVRMNKHFWERTANKQHKYFFESVMQLLRLQPRWRSTLVSAGWFLYSMWAGLALNSTYMNWIVLSLSSSGSWICFALWVWVVLSLYSSGTYFIFVFHCELDYLCALVWAGLLLFWVLLCLSSHVSCVIFVLQSELCYSYLVWVGLSLL